MDEMINNVKKNINTLENIESQTQQLEDTASEFKSLTKQLANNG